PPPGVRPHHQQRDRASHVARVRVRAVRQQTLDVVLHERGGVAAGGARGTEASWFASALPMNKRRMSPRAAPLLATERNALTSMLAPSNTSGHQKWNGTAEILKPIPAINPRMAITSSALAPGPAVEPACAIRCASW